VKEDSPLIESSTHVSGYSSDCGLGVDYDFKNKEVVINGILMREYMTSNDLNECVATLLRKEKLVIKNLKKVIRYNPTGKEKEKRKRLRKNKG